MSDMTSEEYKRGFITGLAMNPLMVTTEAKSSSDRQTVFESAPLITMKYGSFQILDITDIVQTEQEE